MKSSSGLLHQSKRNLLFFMLMHFNKLYQILEIENTASLTAEKSHYMTKSNAQNISGTIVIPGDI